MRGCAVTAVAAGALPDGTPVIISGGEDSTVRVWRLADGPPVGEPLAGHDGPVTAVAAGALPDGTPVIISGGEDSTVRVWRLADGSPVGSCSIYPNPCGMSLFRATSFRAAGATSPPTLAGAPMAYPLVAVLFPQNNDWGEPTG